MVRTNSPAVDERLRVVREFFQRTGNRWASTQVISASTGMELYLVQNLIWVLRPGWFEADTTERGRRKRFRMRDAAKAPCVTVTLRAEGGVMATVWIRNSHGWCDLPARHVEAVGYWVHGARLWQFRFYIEWHAQEPRDG